MAIDWDKTCWHQRWGDNPCRKPATHQGPKTMNGRRVCPYVQSWRACDEHKLKHDIPLES